MTPLLLVGAVLVTLVLWVMEWRRTNRRRLFARLAATAGAVAALLLLSGRPSRPVESANHTTVATLLTPGAPPVATEKTPPPRCALPGTVPAARSGATLLPDVGTLRRRFPHLRSLSIVGDGLDPAELPALNGLQVDFQPAGHPTSDSPAIDFLRCPREIPLGDPLLVSGHLTGLRPGGTIPLSLEAPDGNKIEAVAGPADSRGGADFDLRATALPAVGRYEWRLLVDGTDEPLGVSITPPTLPRILILEGAPRFDTAALRRWFADGSGTMTIRTQIGKDVFRYAAARGTAPQFTEINPPLLAEYDLVVADGRALVALRPEERATLTSAIEKTGLGLLITADDALLPPSVAELPADLVRLAPWKLAPLVGTDIGEQRTVRLRWPSQTTRSEIPLPVPPVTITPTVGQTVLANDLQQQTMVAAIDAGRGQLALSLVGDTTRFLRENDQAAFAAYWSHLFSSLSRPADGGTGHWTLVNGDAGPVFVDHPLELRWFGPSPKPPAPASVSAGFDQTKILLPLAGDVTNPGVWRTTFWPREPGWHRVTSAPGDATLDFYVHPANSWPAWQAENRRRATARFAVESATLTDPPPVSPSTNQPLSPGWWFVLFIAASGYLWTERRFAASR